MNQVYKLFRRRLWQLMLLIPKRISHLMLKFSDVKEKNRQNLERIKDQHKGRRAFIICNGPSLSPKDLDRIAENGDISIASNKIDRIFSQTSWRPTYYCIFDEWYQFTMLDVMNKVPAEIKFFRMESYWKTRHVLSPTIWLNADGDRALLEHPAFSECVTEKVYAIATVTYVMLQIAVHMGIREIYIIGADNRYARERRKDGTLVNYGSASYFAGSDKKDNGTTASVWEMDTAYDFAAKYAKAHGIQICNATRGGYLEAFPRVDFDSLFPANN